MSSGPFRGGRKWVVVADIAMTLWLAGWVATGLLVADNIREIGQLSTTLGIAAEALEQTADGLSVLERLPFVGERIGDIAREIDAAAESAAENAEQSSQSVERLSWLLGLAIGVIPVLPVLAFYAPWRVIRIREVHEIRRALRSDDSALVRKYLANRALARLPYHRLRDVSDQPWRDFEEGRHDALAEAELRRLGIRNVRSSGV